MEDIHRDVMKEVKQRGAVTSFDSMSREAFEGYLDSLYLSFGNESSDSLA
jgi:hypothetical protein